THGSASRRQAPSLRPSSSSPRWSSARACSRACRGRRCSGHRPNARGIPMTWRTVLASACVVAAGVAAAHTATDGFQAYTLESARRLEALRSPAPVPRLALELDDGRTQGLDAIAARVLLVDFVYTRCDSYCSVLGAVFTRLQERLAPEIASGAV